MDLARRIYSRDLKIAAMREIDGGRRIGEVARHLKLSPSCWSDGGANGRLAVPWRFPASAAVEHRRR
jgi:hypothetical protein